MVILGGWAFLMSEVPLYRDCIERNLDPNDTASKILEVLLNPKP